jgi:hypothetical protein
MHYHSKKNVVVSPPFSSRHHGPQTMVRQGASKSAAAIFKRNKNQMDGEGGAPVARWPNGCIILQLF